MVDRLLGGASSPPKLRAGWEHWGAANFGSMKGACNIAFSESGKPERKRAAFRNAYKKAEFLKLGEEEIKQWNEDALNAHTKAKQEWKDRKGEIQEMSPADAQE